MAAGPSQVAGVRADTAEPKVADSAGRSTAESAQPAPRHDLPLPSAQPLHPTVATAVDGLISAFAPALGLDPDGIRIELESSPARPAAGTAALSDRGALIRLTVGAAESLPDRALLVHELTHVAHHANRERGLADPDTTAAEAEASALAAAVRDGTRLWLPRAALPAGRVAADGDASGVSPRAPEPTAAGLAELVKTTHAGELARIQHELDSIWTTTGSLIETTLQMLESVDFVTACAMLRTFKQAERMRLGHLDDSDHQRHPVSAAAVIASLTATEITLLNVDGEDHRNLLETALHGLNVGTATPAVMRGVLAALRHVPEPVLIRLMRSDRRDVFRDLLATPAPPGTDADDLRDAWQRETRAAAAASEDAARDIVDRLRARNLSGVEYAHAALDALTPLAEAVSEPAPPAPSELLRAAVTALDAARMIDPILDHLPENERSDDANAYSQTLRRVLAARAPALTLPRIESLLSYGLFDWAIRDYEAIWAYFLVKTLPLAEQDAWRVREDGKWFQRLEENLPDEFRVSSAYTGVGSEFTAGLPGDRAAEATEIDILLTRIWGHWRANHDGSSAIWVTRTLIGRDPEHPDAPPVAEPRAEIRTQAARRFDAGGDLDDLYNSFPDNYIYNLPGRGELLDLNAMRDPVHLWQRASRLLSTGIFDWWVSSREAWIAYQLVRALSPEEQEHFQRDHADKWSSMMSAMTPEQRASTAVTPLTGRGPWPSREQLRERLRDDRLWNPAHAAQLRALMDILRASDDGEFVFGESTRHSLAGLERLVADLRLFDPNAQPPRTTYQPEQIHGQGVGTDILDFIGFGVRGALVLVGSLFVVNILGRSVTATDYNLNWLQWAMGGDLDGVRLASGDRPSGPPPGGSRAAQAAAERDEDDWAGEEVHTNRLSFQADLNSGVVHLSLPELLLDGVNFVRAGSAYRTGRVRLAGLDVTASFSDRHYRTPVGVEADAEEIGVDDMVIANATVGALALAHLFLRALHLQSGATGAEDIGSLEPASGSTPIPLLGPLWDALTNVIAVRGSVPFSPSLIDLMLMPVTPPGLSFWESEAVSLGQTAANALIPTPHPLDYLWGLATDGTLRPPRTVGERATDAMRMLRSVNLRFSELTIEGLSLGAGTQAASITIRDLDVGLARSRPAYLRQLIRSLELALGRAAGTDRDPIEARLRQAREELYGTPEHPGGLEALETELEGLERRDRWIAGSLSPAESRRMSELSDLLRRDTGAVVDIGSIEVGEVSGAVQARGAVVSGIHLDGHVPIDTGGAYYSDEELAARFRGSVQPPATTTPADVHLTVASAALTQDPAGGPALRIVADRVPTAADVQDRLTKMAPGANPELRARLQDVLPLLGELETLRAAEHPTDVQQQRITALTNQVRERLGITVGSLSLGPITGGLDATGALTATAHGIDAQDIVGDGYAVRRVTGDVTLGVPGVAGLLGDARTFTDAATRDRATASLTARFGLDVTVEHAETETGTAVERATISVSGDVARLPDGYRLTNVWIGQLVLAGFTMGAPDTDLYVRGDEVTLEGVSAGGEVHFMTVGGERQFARAVISDLRIDRVSGRNLTYESTDTEAGRKLHVEVASGALGGIVARNITIARDSSAALAIEAGADVGGIDDLRYTFVRTVLSNGSTRTVTGRMRGGAMPPVRTEPPPRPQPGASPAARPADQSASGGPPPVLSATYASNDSGRRISLNPHDLDLLGTEIVMPPGRSIVVKQARVGTAPGATAGIDLTTHDTALAVTLDNVELGRVRWRSGRALLTSDGGVTIRTGTVRLRLHDADPYATDVAERSDYLQVDDLDIYDLDAPQLRFSRPPIQIDLGSSRGHPGALHVGRAHLHGLRLPFAADGSPGSPTAGHLDLTGTHIDLRALVADGLAARRRAPDDIHAAGEIDVESIALDIFEGDHYRAHIRGASLGAEARSAGWGVQGGLEGLEGTIDYTPDAVRIEGLHIGSASLDSLQLSTAVGTHPLNLTIDSGGGVYFTDVRANARFNLWQEGERHPADAWFRSLVIDQLEIQRIDAEGLRLELPGDGVVVTIPVQPYSGSGPLPPLATLRHVVIAEPRGPSFEWHPGTAGFMRGTPRVDEITVPRLEAEVAGAFHGAAELHADQVSLGLVERGPFTLDISHPRARMTDPAWLDRPDRTIFVEELGAESVHYSAGTVEVREAHVEHLKFEQPGVLVDVRRASAPGTVSVRTAGTGTIPELRIDDAHIHLDFTAMPAGGGGGGARPIDQTSIESLIDHLQGSAFLNASILVTPPWPANPFTAALPVGATITDGHVTTPRGGTADLWFEFNRVGSDLVLSVHVPVYGMAEINRWSLLPGPSAPSTPSSLVDRRTLDLSSISINLSVRSPAPIPIALVGNPVGTITLAPNALVDLSASGHLRPLAGGTPAGAGYLHMSMSELNVESSDFVVSGVGVTTGRIEIRDMHDGFIDFDGTDPLRLDATIRSGVAHDISWDLHRGP